MKKSIKNTYVFSARFQSLFFLIFMRFLSIFDDFWDAKSTSKADLRYFRKTFKTMILSSKSRVRASPKPEKVTPKTFKKHACVSNLFFHDFIAFFMIVESHSGVQTAPKTIKKSIRKSMQKKTLKINPPASGQSTIRSPPPDNPLGINIFMAMNLRGFFYIQTRRPSRDSKESNRASRHPPAFRPIDGAAPFPPDNPL